MYGVKVMDKYFLERSSEETQERPNIVQIFGKENLEEVQKNISKATGLAFVTVDYKGEPVTETTGFTKFCQAVRHGAHSCSLCKKSDAFGALQSAISRKPSVYFCPCGLLEVAIPLEDKGTFLGGYIGGQIVCRDAPPEVPRMEGLLKQNQEILFGEEMKALREQVKEYSYDQFMNIVNLIYMIINQMCANKNGSLKGAAKAKQQAERLKKQKKALAYQNELLEQRLANIKMNQNPYFIANTLASISGLAILEQAPQTSSLVLQFADYMKNAMRSPDAFWSLGEELEQIERYIGLSCAKFGENFSYQIRVIYKLQNRMIPVYSLLPFVEDAIFYGIALKEGEAKLTVTGTMEDGIAVIVIEENGPGYDDGELREKFRVYDGMHEGRYITNAENYAVTRLKKAFGEEYVPSIEVQKGIGRRIRIRIPETIIGGMDGQ